MESASEDMVRMSKSRIDILSEFMLQQCVPGCNGQWKWCAEDILNRNGLTKTTFAGAIYDLLRDGRGKNRNILITGVANCGKTFILSPLSEIYKCFCNPANTSFAWVGADSAEVIFLNDFRWSPSVIAWNDLLLLLEGALVHLPAPKSHFAQDMTITGSTPVFATSKQQLIYIKNGQIDERETEMMCVRWRHFVFHAQIPLCEQKRMAPCGPCFSKFVLENRE